ncbi:MAG TPA: hypothetical protein VKA83_22285 [Methylomirabilota bacterium]|nr:hypothetical protein [Methylomirabilota bacterium]
MTTDDILDRLFDARSRHGDVQLLADAHSAIYRLTAERDRYARESCADREAAYELTWQLREEKIAHGNEVSKLRAELASARVAHRRAVDDLNRVNARNARDRADAAGYRAAVCRLPAYIRRRRAEATVVAPQLTDKQLLELALSAIERANRTYAAAPPELDTVDQTPERMTA